MLTSAWIVYDKFLKKLMQSLLFVYLRLCDQTSNMATNLFANPTGLNGEDQDPWKQNCVSASSSADNQSLFGQQNKSPQEGFGFGSRGPPFNYMWYDNRLESYSNWPKSHPMKPESLAGAGFYYTGTSDKVRCYWCDLSLHQWEVFDSSIEQHKKHSKGNCNFLKIYFPSSKVFKC